MLECFNPHLGQIWTNPAIGCKMLFKKNEPTAGLSIFDPNMCNIKRILLTQMFELCIGRGQCTNLGVKKAKGINQDVSKCLLAKCDSFLHTRCIKLAWEQLCNGWI